MEQTQVNETMIIKPGREGLLETENEMGSKREESESVSLDKSLVMMELKPNAIPEENSRVHLKELDQNVCLRGGRRRIPGLRKEEEVNGRG